MCDEEERQRLDVHPEVRHRMFEVARELRKQETHGEQMLWDALRNRKLAGRKFRRQHPIATFVVDFFCASERLVVEGDGRIHDDQQEADAVRQETIESTGVRVLRLDTDLVERNLPEALRQIEQCLDENTA